MNEILGIENVDFSLSTHYIVYKIINNYNGKHYIGQHITENVYDDYYGSGVLIKKALIKYDISCFTKIILFDYNNIDDMDQKEKELVPLSSCYPYDEMSYNLREGGSQARQNPISIQKNRETQIRNGKSLGENNPMYGKHISSYMTTQDYKQWKQELGNRNRARANDPQWLQKMHDVSVGDKNPMYGHSCTEYMSQDEIDLWKKHISEATTGEKNPMYGKNSWENCTEEERNRRKRKYTNSMKGKNKGKVQLINKSTGHSVFVTKDQAEQYYKNGYERIVRMGNKPMYRPGIDIKAIFVEKDRVDEYLKNGYIIGLPRKRH